MRIVIMIAVLAVFGCDSKNKSKVAPELAVVASATAATAVRIDPDSKKEISAPVELDGKQLGEVRGVLLDPASYSSPNKCSFVPGVKVSFHGGDAEGTTLLLCFACGDLEISGPAGSGYQTFKPAYGRLAAWAKQVFPDDPAIQALGSEP